MANVDSSTGGILQPESSPAPEQDAELDALFQSSFAQITGLPGQFVRPRWQPGNPKQPEASVDWCAIGVTSSKRDAGPAITHQSEGEGTAKYVRHEDIKVLASFYGPHAKANADLLCDGLALPQNLEPLKAHDISFIECGEAVQLPDLLNQIWVRRYDVPVRFRRKVTRIYAVRSIVAADIHLIDDTHVDELITVPPAP